MKPLNLEFGDGEQSFKLTNAGLEELQENCDAGVAVVFNRLQTMTFKFQDFRETIRIALIGGGKTPMESLNIVKRYCDERPALESVQVAQAILATWMVGIEDVLEDVNEGEEDEEPKKTKAQTKK